MLLPRTMRPAAMASLVMLSLAVAGGCAKDDDDDKDKGAATSTPAAPATPPPAAPPPPATPPPAAPPPAAPPPVAPASDVERYPATEKPLSGGAVLANAVPAHKRAHVNGALVQNLAKGTQVLLMAQEVNWTLVGWKEGSLDRIGWVESAKAFGQGTVTNDPRVPKGAVDEARRRGVLFPR
jgi:hypothetical protein